MRDRDNGGSRNADRNGDTRETATTSAIWIAVPAPNVRLSEGADTGLGNAEARVGGVVLESQAAASEQDRALLKTRGKRKLD